MSVLVPRQLPGDERDPKTRDEREQTIVEFGVGFLAIAVGVLMFWIGVSDF